MPRKRNKGERNSVRYFFYIIFIALIASMVILPYLYSFNEVSYNNLISISTIAQSLVFPLIAVVYFLITRRKLSQVSKNLGLSRKTLTVKNILIGILIFFIILVLELGLELFSSATGIQLPTNVQQVLGGLPVYFLVFSALIAPINEEILFRGFMVPTWWIKKQKNSKALSIIFILFSALIFGFLHYLSYASISEFIAAFVFGIIAGYVRNKTQSIYPSIAAHIIVNILAVLALVSI